MKNTIDFLDIVRAQKVLDGRNGSKFIPKSYITARYSKTYVDQAVQAKQKQKARKLGLIQRMARKIQRLFN